MTSRASLSAQRWVQGWGRRTVIGVPYLFLVLFFSFPFLVVLRISITEMTGVRFEDLLTWADNTLTLRAKFTTYFFLTTDPLYLRTYLSSLGFASLNTLICLTIGYPFAYFMARSPATWRPALLMLVSLPFWTSYLLRVYAWKGLLDNDGIVNHLLLWLLGKDGAISHLLLFMHLIHAPVALLHSPLNMMHTAFSMMVGMVYTYLPFMILPVYGNLVKMDLRLLEAAADLGSTPFRTFWLVTVPLSVPGIVAGSMLVLIPSIGEYVIPELLGGSSTYMIGQVLWDEFFKNVDWSMASAVAVSMVVLILIPLAVFNHYQTRGAGRGSGA